jgi:hypothetical protein
MVAGRHIEIQIMRSLLESSRSDFLAMYGRRRIGKTYLIRQVYKADIFFECSGLHEQSMPQQMENFWYSMTSFFPTKKLPVPKTWLQAFALLKDAIASSKSKKKKVIFLDEIAWFETPRSGFLSALNQFWNQFCDKRNDVLLVICGSATSWILEKIINNRGGLHNRITRSIALKPFTLGETKEYLDKLGVRLRHKDIASLYMAVGGVPYYLQYAQPGKSSIQIIDELLFKPQAILRNEFENLYPALFKHSELHVQIVTALAGKQKGLTRSEILDITGINSGGGFTKVMNELVSCGFVKEILPSGKTKADALFRLIDEYTVFYFRFLYKVKGKQNWAQLGTSQKYKVWAGFAFESLCLKHTDQIKRALGIQGMVTNEWSWIKKPTEDAPGAQIDMIIDRADNCQNIIEAKFMDEPFNMKATYADQLRAKMNLYRSTTKTRKNLFLTLVTTTPSIRNAHYLSVVHNEVLMEELFV